MLLPFELGVLVLSGALFTLAQQACNPANDQINTLTLDFSSDCNTTQFCSADAGATSGTCADRACRKDEFPFGWGNTTLPPRCGTTKFCPDQGNGCQPLVPLDGPCELNRDDACEPPPDPALQKQLADSTNVNGAICLNQHCTTAYSDVATRDNCLRGMYCDPTSLTCTPRLPAHSTCNSDRSCLSSICATNGRCTTVFDPAHSTPPGVTVVCTLIVLGIMGGFVWWLLKEGRTRRDLGRIERKRVWLEQTLLRMQMEQVERQERKERGWSWSGDSQETLYEKY
ncbi:hypothetical protein JCM11641_000434 [Rhodosporidiobolus odoratus]